MKKALKMIVIILISLVAGLMLLNLFTARNIKTEIVINATPQKVWQILMNHEAHPEWNPFIRQISGSTEVGEYLNVTVQSEGNKPMEFQPVVLVNKENREFRWVGKLMIKGIADGEHYFLLEEVGSDQVKLTHGENFTGLLSGLLMKMVGKDTEKGFNAMNLELAKLAENND